MRFQIARMARLMLVSIRPLGKHILCQKTLGSGWSIPRPAKALHVCNTQSEKLNGRGWVRRRNIGSLSP